MVGTLRNVIVVGGSYVGRAAAIELAQVVPTTHRVLLIEPHSHFHHLFAFPRFAVVPGHEHKAFIPYNTLFSSVPNSSLHAIVQARVLSVEREHVNIDLEWQGSKQIPFEYLTVATGATLAEPGSMKYDDKPSSVQYLRKHQEDVQRSKSILIVGGGAVGVQMATDLKEYYPDKEIVLVHSREHLMPLFHSQMHDLIKDRFNELGVKLVTGARVVVPSNGFPNDGSCFEVQLMNGSKLSTELVILATGQRPNNSLIKDLNPTDTDSLINPTNGFIRIRPTMQFLDKQYSNMFAVGDIADTGMHKAARPGHAQAIVVAKNIQALIEGREPQEQFDWSPAGIHLSLGMKRNVKFRNPNIAEGHSEPFVNISDDGQEDLGVERMWARAGLSVNGPSEYHL